jgi:hypothetical protein
MPSKLRYAAADFNPYKKNFGTLNGGVTTSGDGWGVLGRSWKFDGSTGNIQFSGTTGQVGTSNFSFGCCFKTTISAPSTGYMIAKSKFNGQVGRYGLGINDGGTGVAALFTNDTGGVLTSYATGFADGNWHFAVVTVDRSAGAVTVYIDGNSVASGTTTASPTTSWTTTDNLLIGAYNDPSGGAAYTYFFPGSITGVFEVLSLLSKSQVSSLYSSLQTGEPYRLFAPSAFESFYGFAKTAGGLLLARRRAAAA